MEPSWLSFSPAFHPFSAVEMEIADFGCLIKTWHLCQLNNIFQLQASMKFFKQGWKNTGNANCLTLNLFWNCLELLTMYKLSFFLTLMQQL